MSGKVTVLADPQREVLLTEIQGGASLTFAARKAHTTKARIVKFALIAQQAEARLLAGEVDEDDLEEWERWAIGLLTDMEVAQGELEKRLIDVIVEVAEKKNKWEAAAWLLERSFPERWAKRPVLAKPQQNIGVQLNVGAAGIEANGQPDSVIDTAKRMLEMAERGAAEAAARGLPPADPGTLPVIEVEGHVAAPVLAKASEVLDLDDPDLGF